MFSQDPLKAQLHLIEADRFDEKIHHTVFKGLYGVFHRRITGHDNHRDGVVLHPDMLGKFQSIHFRHIDVRETAVDPFGIQYPGRLQPVFCRYDIVALLLEILMRNGEDIFFVIDEQDSFIHTHASVPRFTH